MAWHVHLSRFRATETIDCVYPGRGYILINWFMQLWRLASSKCAGQASWLGTQGRVDTTVKSPKMQHPFYLGGISISLLKPSADWLRPTHIVENNLLSSKSTKININHICRIPLQHHLDCCWNKYLGTRA